MTENSPADIRKLLGDYFADQPRVLEWGAVRLDSPLPNADRLKAWVGQGMHAGLRYMEERLEERQSPRKLFPWAKTAVLFSLRQPVPFGTDTGAFHVASYALGEDYHHVARRILHGVEKHLRVTSVRFESFCDTWPVFERDLAAEAGLGWRGKNTCLIHKKHGSGFLLAGFFLDVELDDTAIPVQDFCGGCSACIDQCPTNALLEPGKLDATKCLSYWTIEAKGTVPPEISKKAGGWIFGCDICQEVCPWNHKHKKTDSRVEPKNWPHSAREWLELLRKGGGFQARFKGTPLLRAGRRSLLRNVLMALRQKPDLDLEELLASLENEETNPDIVTELQQTRELMTEKRN